MIKIKLEETMKKKDYTIGTLAEKTNMHRNGISKIINGKTKGIEFATLNRLCIALDCEVHDIIEFVRE